jgi:hypothetical protein
MPDVVVLLPGITGSVLKQHGKVVWGFSAGTIGKALLTLGASMERTLALPDDDPSKEDLDDGIVADALIPDLHLLPGLWKIDGYTKITEAIAANFEVREGKNFFQFPYDWRRDNRVAARKLAKATKSWLTAWRQSSGKSDAKLILVAHSMGGLVSRYFLECLEGWKDTKALITFGTPYRGSLNALDMLANGFKKGPFDLSKVAREFTAVYQLLPIFECYDAGDGKLVRVGEMTDGIPNVDAKKAAAALAFHREIEKAVASNQGLPQYQSAGYRIHPVVGIQQQTNLSARFDRGKVMMLQTYKGDALGGDGTVPRMSAIPIELSANPAANYAATQHGSLQNADAVIVNLTGVLSGFILDLGTFKKPKITVGLEVEDLYFVNEPISVRASPSKDVALRATLWRSGEGTPLASVAMTRSGEDWYGAEFVAPGAGAYRVAVSGDDVEDAEDAFAVVEAENRMQPQAQAVGESDAEPPLESIPIATQVDPLIRWDQKGSVLTVAADRSLRSVLRRADVALSDRIHWIVVVRSHDAGPYYYAYRWHELEALAENSQERLDWPLHDAILLHEWTSSAVARGSRPFGVPNRGQESPAAGRIVDFNAAGRIVAIGEYRDRFANVPGNERVGTIGSNVSASIDDDARASETLDLGPMRGGRVVDVWQQSASADIELREPHPSVIAPDRMGPTEAVKIEVTISAETKSEIEIGASEPVDFRIELSSGATPLAAHQAALARSDLPIEVLLSVENDALEIVRSREIKVDPPASGRPSIGYFMVKGTRAGVSRLAVTFRQGGSDLGVIGLAVEVVASGAKAGSTQSRATAAPADPADDDKLAVMIEQRTDDKKVFYRYTLHSEALNLQYEAFDSKPLLDRGGGPAATPLAFVQHIYARVTQELKSFDDLKELQRQARALGASLSRELFDPDVARRLWPLRDRIKLIQIRSWEPYIPWELVRLHNPDTDETDDRFLAEYNLVRTLTDRPPARWLAMEKWSYLAATFPIGSLPAVGAELDYFTGSAVPSLHARSITPNPIAATKDAFYDALADGQFDVLHISCHAESAHQSIEDASLIIGDATTPGESKPHLIQVDTETVRNEAKLTGRQPLVFLNACETGRIGAVLTAWGGWPNVFLRAGAGAFVGAAWAVRDKPAAAFSTTFYEALFNNKTLAEAVGAARQAAKKHGDASWLAFKVYGHPRARRGKP